MGENFVIKLYPSNEVADKANLLFEERISFVAIDLLYKIKYYNYEVFKFISQLDLNRLFISLTSSDSIFYRFSTYGNNYEFKLELFLDYNPADNRDIQCALHIYNNANKIGAYYGNIEYISTVITKTYEDKADADIYFENISSLPENEIKKYDAEVSSSFAC